MTGFLKSFVIGFVLVIALGAMVGCSSTPSAVSDSRIILNEEYRPLNRDQIIIGIQECESSGTRPVMQRADVRIGGKLTSVVIDVTCSPKYTSQNDAERWYRRGYDSAYDRYK